MDSDWRVSLVAGALAFATADVLCDVVISEGAAEEAADDDGRQPGASCELKILPSTPAVATAEYSRVAVATPKATAGEEDDDAMMDKPEDAKTEAGSDDKPEDEAEAGLTGTQDAAISGLVTVAWLLLVTASQLTRAPAAAASSLGASLKWRPHTHAEFWLALLGGACAFSHDFFLLRAFEGAPSTVILPLIQVASVSVLVGSSFVALYRGEPWISPTHAVAYGLMFVGGLLPAASGDVSRLLRPGFWRQRYVAYAVLSELTYGMHGLLVSSGAWLTVGRPPLTAAFHSAP